MHNTLSCRFLCLIFLIVLAQFGTAAEPDPARLRQAVVKGISLIETSSAEYLKQRQCFSCHHQAMPVVMLSEAKKRGFEIDEQNFQAQVQPHD